MSASEKITSEMRRIATAWVNLTTQVVFNMPYALKTEKKWLY